MYAAPALAQSRAWLRLKHRVMLTGMPLVAQGAGGAQPLQVVGIFTTMCSLMAAQAPALGDHALGVQGEDLAADRPLHQVADLLEQGVGVLAAGLGHEGRVGGDAVTHTHALDLGNGLEVGGVDEELHGVSLVGWGRLVRVAHLGKVQWPCGGAGAGRAAIAGLDDRRQVVGMALPPAHFGQGAHHGAHHVMEEAVGLDVEDGDRRRSRQSRHGSRRNRVLLSFQDDAVLQKERQSA